jgi:DNA-binding IscR family transcriptional regulator
MAIDSSKASPDAETGAVASLGDTVGGGIDKVVSQFEQAVDAKSDKEISKATDSILASFLISFVENDTTTMGHLDELLRRVIYWCEQTSDRSFDKYLGQILAVKKLVESLRSAPSTESIGKVRSMEHGDQILQEFLDSGIVSPSALSRKLGVSSQRVSQIFGQLGKMGLVRRDQMGRTAYYVLTTEGRRVGLSILGPSLSTRNSIANMAKALEILTKTPSSSGDLAGSLGIPESVLTYLLSPLVRSRVVKIDDSQNYVLTQSRRPTVEDDVVEYVQATELRATRGDLIGREGIRRRDTLIERGGIGRRSTLVGRRALKQRHEEQLALAILVNVRHLLYEGRVEEARRLLDSYVRKNRILRAEFTSVPGRSTSP